MTEISTELVAAARAMSPWEVLAVLLAIAYLVLAIREHIGCWIAAFFSTSIYLVLMYQAGLYMESALQVFYIGMAIYGWRTWQRGDGASHDLPVTSWAIHQHILPVALVFLATVLSGYLLDRFTGAAMPFLDSFTTWGAIVTTWMVARKILQNWHYWFVIDSISIYLYTSRGLYLTALLFVLYLVLIVIGYRQWRRSMEQARG